MPTIAVIGASSRRNKFGNKCVRAYLHAGYDVYPINPTETEIEGLKVYRSVAELPLDRLDRVSLYLAPKQGLGILPDIASKPVGEVWFNPGTESREVLDKAAELGLNAITDCSIVDLGLSPSQFPDE